MKFYATATGLIIAVACSSILLSGRAHAQFPHETMEEREKRRMIDEENENLRQMVESSKEMSVRRHINVIVMLAGELAGAEIMGAGIVVGGDKERLYVATANHLVRRGSAVAQNLQITLERHEGNSPRLSRPATLLPAFDQQLDLAVLSIADISAQQYNVCKELAVLSRDETDLKAVLPIGNPNGKAWIIPAVPDAIVKKEPPRIFFQSQVLSRGHSGGGLLATDGSLLGMIVEDSPPFGIALNVHEILRTLHRWRIPEQLGGENCNLNQDYVAAREYETAAAAGDAAAMDRLGGLYANGNGVAQDNDLAREWYSKAVAAGNTAGMYHLGTLYSRQRDYAKARQWYEKAASAGEAMAMTNLGALYDHGNGVTQDYSLARQWYEKAVAAGDARAMTDLGVLYANGHGVTQDYSLAREWYEKAASAGRSVAMYNLGSLYEKGHGVPQDLSVARQWYEKSAAAGYQPASERLKKLGQ
jgi:tetratricopeptide (TPR) repeat protein